MSFMEMQVTQKGQLYSGDCSRCGRTHFVHEWTTHNNNEERDALQAGTLGCEECGAPVRADTFQDNGKQYAGRFSAPGYLDCTDWHFSRNKKALVRELKDMYGPE